ncbi:MAG: MarR family winged helix-turn-helix transcriptional regulator [Fusobacterium sp.]|nr:MarR family winged helix-turn-helix transcriptional regulator [Fusobacterium sp.]
MERHCIGTLFYNLEQTSRICRAFCENYFKEHGEGHVSFDEFIILETIACYPDSSQRELAKHILKGASHTSKILAVLEKKELITRPVDTKENRIIRRIVLTPKGLEEYKFAEKLALEFAQSVENAIGTKDANECCKFLEKIKQTVNPNSNIVFE